jgi:gliding motility-associated-like protein
VDSHTYQYRVQLIDSCRNEGPYSEPHQPIQLQASEGKGNPELEWTRYQGWPVSAYQVQVEKPDGEGFEPLGPYQRVAPARQQLVDSLSDLEAGQLCYRIIGLRAGGGSTIRTASNTRCIDPTIRLYVPDAFSPNDDGNNDAFRAEGTYITDITLRIYNRWGEKVFQDSGMEASWDGTYRGQTAPAGTYTYVISAKGANSEFIQREGSLQLIR